MNRPRWAGLSRGAAGRLLIYGGAIPMAVLILCPDLPTVWSLWRAGALDDVSPVASALATEPGPDPLQVAQRTPALDAGLEKERRVAALT